MGFLYVADMKAAAPIGIFDSGLGGLSVWKAVRELLPYESMVYYADSAHCPYGPRTQEEIIGLSETIVEYLLDHGAKLILIACNTATAAAIHHLRAHYGLPFVGMEPALKPAAERSKSGKIGILATEGTFQGGHFLQTKDRYAHDKEVHIQVGHGLVEWVEQGILDGHEVEQCLRSYLEPMIDAGVDQIVLGCTHYPFLRPVMERIAAGRAEIIDPAPAVARQVQAVLDQQGGLVLSGKLGTDVFYSSGNLERLKAMLERINPMLKP